MKKLYITLLIIIIFSGCASKKIETPIISSYTLSDIHNIAKSEYGFDIKNDNLEPLYILDGIPLNEKDFLNVLKQYDKKDIRTTSVIESGKKEKGSSYSYDIIILIMTKNFKPITKK